MAQFVNIACHRRFICYNVPIGGSVDVFVSLQIHQTKQEKRNKQ